MRKYSIAKQCMAAALTEAKEEKINDSDVLEALIITLIAEMTKIAGAIRTAEVIDYELRNISGGLDKDFLRSR
jgi:predicted RNase H-like nuclease